MNTNLRTLLAAPPECTPESFQLRTTNAMAPNRVAGDLMSTGRFMRVLSEGHKLFLNERRALFAGERNSQTLARFRSLLLKFGRNGRQPERRLWKLKTVDAVYQVLETVRYEILALSATGALLYSVAMYLRPN